MTTLLGYIAANHISLTGAWEFVQRVFISATTGNTLSEHFTIVFPDGSSST